VLAASCLLCPWHAGEPSVRFYALEDYDNYIVQLGPGFYNSKTWQNLRIQPFESNVLDVRSLTIPAGWEVTLFIGPNLDFDGRTLLADAPLLPDPFDDGNVASFRICASSSSPGEAETISWLAGLQHGLLAACCGLLLACLPAQRVCRNTHYRTPRKQISLQ